LRTERPPLGTFGTCCALFVIIGSILVGVLAPLKHGDTMFDRVAFLVLIDATWICILVSDWRRRRRARR
jgi:hypothetical protein